MASSVTWYFDSTEKSRLCKRSSRPSGTDSRSRRPRGPLGRAGTAAPLLMYGHDAGMSFARDPAGWLEETPASRDRLFLRTPQGRDLSYAALRRTVRPNCLCFESARCAAGRPHRRPSRQVPGSGPALCGLPAVGAVFVPINVANTPTKSSIFARFAAARGGGFGRKT